MKKHFSQAKTKIVILSCCTYNSEDFSQKSTLTFADIPQFPYIQKTDSEEESSCQNSTFYIEVRVNNKIDTQKLISFM